jgi:hypothetical protein
MAHTKTSDPQSKLLVELGKGYRSRRIVPIQFIVAAARTNMTAPNHAFADAIRAETGIKTMMIAPCRGKLLRATVNAPAFPVNGGTITVTIKKAVIGDTDVAMTSALSVENTGGTLTAETAVDATLSTVADAINMIEGQLVYASVAVSDAAVTTLGQLCIELEWLPTER